MRRVDNKIVHYEFRDGSVCPDSLSRKYNNYSTRNKDHVTCKTCHTIMMSKRPSTKWFALVAWSMIISFVYTFCNRV